MISDAAMQKYQRELDVKSFSSLLMETDQKAADELVLSQLFEGVEKKENCKKRRYSRRFGNVYGSSGLRRIYA